MQLLVLAARLVLAFVFLISSLPKLFKAQEFARAIANYKVLPTGLSEPVALWLPRVELACAGLLAFGTLTTPAATALALLLIFFSGAAAINLFRGRRIDCGCFGSLAPKSITWAAVARNLFLAIMATWVATHPSGAAWIGADTSRASGTPSLVQENFAVLIASSTAALGALLLTESWRLRKSRRAWGSPVEGKVT
jgi:putative oxidoreductase